jgi:hypothetical protein
MRTCSSILISIIRMIQGATRWSLVVVYLSYLSTLRLCKNQEIEMLISRSL